MKIKYFRVIYKLKNFWERDCYLQKSKDNKIKFERKILFMFCDNYVNLFYTKNAILNYKFILSRLDNLSSFDEIGELFWLFNELVKYDPTILAIVFFSDLGDKNKDNEISLNKELALKNYELVLNNCLSNKMFQTSFRLISNLLP